MRYQKTTGKGSITSLKYAVLLFTVPLFIASVLIPVLMNQLLDLSIVQNAPLAKTIATTVIQYSQFLDGVVLISFAAITGRIMIKSFRTNMHPIFGIVGLIALPGLAILLGQASNIAGVFTQLSMVQSSVNNFPGSYFLMQNLPQIGTAMAILILIVMVGINRR